jgi:hypothetical protein
MNSVLIPVIAEHDMGNVLFFLVVAVFGIIRFLMDRYGKKEKETPHASSPQPQPESEQTRRTREIQEKIRRRIAQSKTGTAQPASPAQKPAATTTVLHTEQVRMPAPAPQHREPLEVPGSRHRDLMAQLAAARREEEESRRRAAEMVAILREDTAAGFRAGETPLDGDALHDMLRSPDSVREAILLSEILSRPLAERSYGSCPGM